MKYIFLTFFSVTIALQATNSFANDQQFCKVYGVLPGNSNYYSTFNLGSRKIALPVYNDEKSYIPYKLIDRLPFSYVTEKNGYIWQGYDKNHGAGLFIHDNSTSKDILIKRGDFSSVFRHGSSIYVVENNLKEDEANGKKKGSILYKIIREKDVILKEIQRFEGHVSRVLSRSRILYGTIVENDDMYILVGERGWAYLMSISLPDKFLECAN